MVAKLSGKKRHEDFKKRPEKGDPVVTSAYHHHHWLWSGVQSPPKKQTEEEPLEARDNHTWARSGEEASPEMQQDEIFPTLTPYTHSHPPPPTQPTLTIDPVPMCGDNFPKRSADNKIPPA